MIKDGAVKVTRGGAVAGRDRSGNEEQRGSQKRAIRRSVRNKRNKGVQGHNEERKRRGREKRGKRGSFPVIIVSPMTGVYIYIWLSICIHIWLSSFGGQKIINMLGTIGK